MLDLTISAQDEDWLAAEHPALRIRKMQPHSIAGLLVFDMVYCQESNEIILNPRSHLQDHPARITDAYEIGITLQASAHSGLPQVRETGGRLRRVAKERNLDLKGLHINKNLDESACLCIRWEEDRYFPSGFNLCDFFNRLVVPFFYGQSFLEKYREWPWPQYGHGAWGLLEWYGENSGSIPLQLFKEYLRYLSSSASEYPDLQRALAMEKPDKHWPCPCGLKKKFGKCHPLAFEGLRKLKEDLKKPQLKTSLLTSAVAFPIEEDQWGSKLPSAEVGLKLGEAPIIIRGDNLGA